jgi:hypothetical protein
METRSKVDLIRKTRSMTLSRQHRVGNAQRSSNVEGPVPMSMHSRSSAAEQFKLLIAALGVIALIEVCIHLGSKYHLSIAWVYFVFVNLLFVLWVLYKFGKLLLQGKVLVSVLAWLLLRLVLYGLLGASGLPILLFAIFAPIELAIITIVFRRTLGSETKSA